MEFRTRFQSGGMAPVGTEAGRSLAPRTPGQPAPHREPISKTKQSQGCVYPLHRATCACRRALPERQVPGRMKQFLRLTHRASSHTCCTRTSSAMLLAEEPRPKAESSPDTDPVTVGDGAEKAKHPITGTIPSPAHILPSSR